MLALRFEEKHGSLTSALIISIGKGRASILWSMHPFSLHFEGGVIGVVRRCPHSLLLLLECIICLLGQGYLCALSPEISGSICHFCTCISDVELLDENLQLIQDDPNIINEFWGKRLLCTSSFSYVPYRLPFLSLQCMLLHVLLGIRTQIQI